jgi:hypothetical protein
MPNAGEPRAPLADLGELTAQWLEGTIASVPTVWPGCGPDEEATELIPVLAARNRAGYVTTVSRAGEGPAPGYDGAVVDSARGR